MKVKKTLKKMTDEKQSSEHINSILRLSSDGINLMSPDKMSSQNMMDMLITEHELMED